jgi:hypothetical protein
MRHRNRTSHSREELLRRALLGLMRSDELRKTLVFKGGNALDWFHSGSGRASTDLDFSVEESVGELELHDLEAHAADALQAEFALLDLKVVELKAQRVPPGLTKEQEDFWGGVRLAFRLVTPEVWREHGNDVIELRRRSLLIGGLSKVEVDISCREYCSDKEAHLLEGRRVYVYSLPLMVAEKLRAICQQTRSYRSHVAGVPRGRSQDLFDIHSLIGRLQFDPLSPTFIELIKRVFAAKRCPKELLIELPDTRELHRPDFENKLRQTVSADVVLLDYDEYFDFACELGRKIHAAWIE